MCSLLWDPSGDVFKRLLSKLRARPAWSIALDESTDRSDIAQLLVSVRYFNNLVSVCTDGAPSMLGHRDEPITMFRRRILKPNLLFYHCIIHKQSMCAIGGCCLQETMQTVVKIVNLIRARALNHRRFQNHLATFDAEYGDALFYKCSLAEPWSSSGEMCCFLTSSAFLKKSVILSLSWTLSFKFGSASWQTFLEQGEHVAPGMAEAAV